MTKIHKLISLIVLFATALIISHPQDTSAITKNITPPFDNGSIWYICQGYNSGGTHVGVSRLSLDLTGGPNCDSSASGRSIRAPFQGTVAWYVESSGSMCINSRDGKSVMLTHVDPSVQRGINVELGQKVASVAGSGMRQNNGVAHLHLQGWSTSNCSNSANVITFSQAVSMRMCGAPDMVENGPNLYRSGAWGGTRFTATGCTNVDKKADGYIYRFWSDQKQGHFYTADNDEAQRAVDTWPEAWTYENNKTFKVSLVSRNSCALGTSPVYRFWSDQKQGHFYTADEAEKNRVIATWPDVWTYEKVGFYANN